MRNSKHEQQIVVPVHSFVTPANHTILQPQPADDGIILRPEYKHAR